MYPLEGDGEAVRCMRAVDWAATSIGPIEQWSPTLKTMVSMMLGSQNPMFLFWGPESIQFYNDAYIPSFGVGKHPKAMGQRGADCFPELWPLIHQHIEDVRHNAAPVWFQDRLASLIRNGRLEDVYWTYGYSAVREPDGSVGGALAVVSETTQSVVANMRQQAQQDVIRAMSHATSADEVYQRAVDQMTQIGLLPGAVVACWHSRDLPAECILPGGAAEAGTDAAARCVALQRVVRALPSEHADAWQALQQGQSVLLHGVLALPYRNEFGEETIRHVRLIPLQHEERLLRVLALAVYPCLPYDAAHRVFLQSLAASVASGATQAEVRRARERYEQERDRVFMQAPVSVAMLSGQDFTFSLANPVYCRMVRRSYEQVVGQPFHKVFPELMDTPVPGILRRVMETGERHVEPEMKVQIDGGDGQLIDCWFRYTLEPLRDSAGHIIGLVAVSHEVTEQVKAREILTQAHQERQRLLDEAQAAARAKDEFLAMLGHELRNPLAPIVSALHVMERRHTGDVPREEVVIKRQVRHMIRLVDDLMDVSRIARGKFKLDTYQVSAASDLVSAAVEMTQPLFAQRNHRLVVNQPQTGEGSGMLWRGDRHRCVQIVSNLLTNAARYTPPGGLITLNSRADQRDWVIEVVDNGQGIASHVLPHVFEAFFQGEHSEHRAHTGGLGIGLALVKSLVQLHDGHVEAHSDGPGQGSRFVVRLPGAVLTTASSPSRSPAAAAHTGPGCRVLVVDDNEDAAEWLGQTLELAGHEVKVLFDPQAALQLLGETKTWLPDVALIDLDLPRMSGHELAKRLRAMPHMGCCSLVALSGYGQPSDMARAQASGFADYLVKPVDADVLLAALQRACAASTRTHADPNAG